MSQKQGYAPCLNVFLLLLKNERYICSPAQPSNILLSLSLSCPKFPDKYISI